MNRKWVNAMFLHQNPMRQRLWRIVDTDADSRLNNNRTAIDFAGHEVNRGPMFLDTRGERALVCMQTGKRR